MVTPLALRVQRCSSSGSSYVQPVSHEEEVLRAVASRLGLVGDIDDLLGTWGGAGYRAGFRTPCASRAGTQLVGLSVRTAATREFVGRMPE